ncbi:MAG: beta-ketoacyl synthase N-terminal-like domain-containing protein [Kiritimatiellia bacterium]
MNDPTPSIVVSGMGAFTPAGPGASAFWQALLEGESLLRPVRLFPGDAGLPPTCGGQIDGIPAQPADAPRAVRFAVAAGEEALQGLGEAGRASCGLIAATNFATMELPTQDDSQARISDALGLRGPRITLSLSCASGASALAAAADLLAAGRAERMLVVGFDELSPFSWSGLYALRTMARDTVVRPFDASRSGTLFSEGAAALLLERAPACEARGGTPLARLAGWATGNNGFHLTAPSPRGAGSLDVMRRALARANASPADLDFFNAHGTGTKHNDLTESQAFLDLCGERAASIPATSAKGVVGHLLGAAGTAEAIATVLSLREGLIPPTANLETPDPDCPLDVVRGTPRKADIRLALSNSAGIGGCNGAVVFAAIQRHDTPARPIPPDPAKCIVTGIGLLSPLGIGPEENLAALAENEPALEEDADGRAVGRVPPFALADFVPTPKNYLDRQSELLLAACGMAIARRGGLDDVPPERRAVCAATAEGGSDTVRLFLADLEAKGPRLVKPMLFQHAYANTAISLAAMEWELRGPHLNFTTGRMASAQALLAAADLLAAGEADVVLVCAAETIGHDLPDTPRGEAGAALLLERAPPGATPAAAIATLARAGSLPAGVPSPAGAGDPAAHADALCGDTRGAAALLRTALDAAALADAPMPSTIRFDAPDGQTATFLLEPPSP